MTADDPQQVAGAELANLVTASRSGPSFFSRVLQKADFEDLLHDTFLHLYERPTDRQPDRIELLFRSAMRKVYESKRHREEREAHARRYLVALTPESEEPPPDEDISAEQIFFRLNGIIQQLRLPAPAREFYLTDRILGLTHAEMAHRYNMTPFEIRKIAIRVASALTLWQSELMQTHSPPDRHVEQASRFVQAQLGTDSKWGTINARIWRALSHRTNRAITLTDAHTIAIESSVTVDEVMAVITLLSGRPEGPYLQMEYLDRSGPVAKARSHHEITQRVRAWWKDKTLSTHEWESWASHVEVRWSAVTDRGST